MKKIIAIAFAAALTMFGAAESSFAQEAPPTCAEADNREGLECYPIQTIATTPTTTTTVAPTTTVVGGEGGTIPPPSTTTTTTTTTTVAPTTTFVAGEGGTVPRTPTGSLPRTGGSGASGILQVGALLLMAGAVVFVAARRRSPATAA